MLKCCILISGFNNYNSYQKRDGSGGSPRSQRHNFQQQQQGGGAGRLSPNQGQPQNTSPQAFQQKKQGILLLIIRLFEIYSKQCRGVSRSSVVKCLTRNPGVLGSSRTGSSGFFSRECPWARCFRAQPGTGET